jgi:hypothetical protein
MAEHTPGPLEVRQRFYIGVPGDPYSLAEMKSCRTVPADRVDEHEANARRIVALWNLCEPLSTEELDAALALDSPRDRMARLMRLASEAMVRAPLTEGRTDA